MTTKKPPLRAVADDEVVPPAKPLSVAQAAKSGSHRDLLVAMRDRIADTVTNGNCPPRDLASLTKRLQDIANEIEAIDAREDDAAPGRLRELESALREIQPDHPMLTGTVDDRYDASAI
ncbi:MULTISPECIES: hypothetical protein [Rhodococcus]|uniref:hypothetical protein n=1 Tax=Rhodococcus TaxID=1827 RepID=UPI00295437A6|nr:MULTISPECIES: hypothetical protein [Rhodococcus]MDV7244491.1 hypothetical protein [Rhodococcus oxybenzonivorans]MDV7274266.1 hypothetical protein [Rhodococcus oxybenzonivorans]MDV7337848.1 hypothetical protein [Rhodococcus oxybenzonivorans]MDV7345216.1 hypothetical protein [Rhodococcus oxybenzonivorans]MDV8028904.1 hypothetical protein [Rhodococcus sp. IEGM 27]